MSKDLSIMIDDAKLNVRVGAILRYKGKILVEKNTSVDFGVVPGGRIKTMESTRDALIREVREETVRKFFLQGDCEVLVIFEETGREILIDDFSSEDDIRKYLGPKFINKKR